MSDAIRESLTVKNPPVAVRGHRRGDVLDVGIAWWPQIWSYLNGLVWEGTERTERSRAALAAALEELRQACVTHIAQLDESFFSSHVDSFAQSGHVAAYTSEHPRGATV